MPRLLKAKTELSWHVMGTSRGVKRKPSGGRRKSALQSETPALDDRIFEPYGVRAAGWISLSGCQQTRVQLNPRRDREKAGPPPLRFRVIRAGSVLVLEPTYVLNFKHDVKPIVRIDSHADHLHAPL
jgi:hypothetical protein